MPSIVQTVNTQAQCPHAAPGTLISTAATVTIDGAAPMLQGDSGLVTGCPFTLPGGKPQPCVKIVMILSAQSVLVENKPVLLLNPGDLCQSAEQAPNGPAVWVATQTKVTAT